MQPIEIIGGGLAGLSLGLALRHRGVPVTLFEAGEFPRHRVCGEFIAGLEPVTIDALQLAPCLTGSAVHREVAWMMPDGGRHRQVLPAAAYGISRYELDARLARAFVAAGGDLRVRTRALDFRNRPGRVVATGRKKSDPRWLGLKVHAIDLHLDSDLEVHLGREAYVGLSRVEGNRVNVCGLFRVGAASGGNGDALGKETSKSRVATRMRAEPFFARLESAGLGSLAKRLRTAAIDPASFVAVAALGFGTATPRRAGLAIGDAWALIPPFTGNGMAMAFQSAALAVGPLVQYADGEITWDRACAITQAALVRRFRTRLLAASALHPFLLQPRRQRGLAALSRARLLPFRPLFAVLH